MDNKYELIFTILNRGFSDLAMDSARQSGATGGTIITARGTGAKEVEKLFGLTISQEKEIILILTPKEKRNDIMSAICKSAGLNTQGKGIAFSLPVDDVLGVSLGITRPPVGEEPESSANRATDDAAEIYSAQTKENPTEKVSENVVSDPEPEVNA